MKNKIYTKEQYEECNRKLITALFSFQYTGYPFWTVLASKLHRIPVSDFGTIDTVVTTKGVQLRYDPEVVLKADNGKLRYTLVHECLHLIYRHMFRFKFSDSIVDLARKKSDGPVQLMNAIQPIKTSDLACDLIANRDLFEMFNDFDRFGVTSSDVPDFKFDLRNKTSEDVEQYIVDTYAQVVIPKGSGGASLGDGKSQSDQNQNGSGGGKQQKKDDQSESEGGGKQSVNGKDINNHVPGQSETESEMTKRIKQRMVEGMVSDTANAVGEKAKGSMPQSLQDEIDLIKRPPRKDWRALLAAYVKGSIPKSDRRTWARINRRVPYLIKGRKPKYIPLIGVCVDTSGSVSNTELSAFLEEIDHIRKIYGTDIEIVQCDAEISQVLKVKSKDPMPKSVLGRGGTEFYPALDYFANAKRKPDVVVFFTDLAVGDDDVPSKPYSYNLIWVGTAEAQVEHFQNLNKYGVFIYMNPEEEQV